MKIPKRIKNYKVIVDNKLKDFGETDDKKKIVKINRKKSLKLGGQKELKDTIIHEKMHVLHPKMSEKTVRKEVERITGHKTAAFDDSEPKEPEVNKRDLAIKGLV